MAEFRKLIITTAGFDFLTQAISDNTAIAFSRVVLAAQNYTDEEIAGLLTLTNSMQTITNLGIVKPSPETIQVTAMVSNGAVECGYSYSSIGLFAKSANDQEVLFAVCGSNVPGDIPPNTHPFSVRLELLLTISNAEQITFTVDDKIISGTHGIYVGSGEMPDGYDIQIDPEGEALLLDNEMSNTSENVPKTKVVKAYVDAVAKESVTYPGCFYRISDRGFIEWLNPPMLPGVEYLTTERHNGEPVWVKLVELGNPPSCTEEYGVPKKDEDENIVTDENGNTVYTHYCKDVKVIEYGEICWCDVWITRPDRSGTVIQRLPMYGNGGNYYGKAHVIQNKIIQLNFVRDATAYTVHALVKFTRPKMYTTPATTEWERAMLERIDLAMLHIVALRDVPKSPSGVTAAGDVLTGINYSSVFKDNSATTYSSANNRLVGTGTSLSTYYSSLENPASIMYTSGDVDLTSTSWSSYYGMDCSGFVSYALGFGEWVWTMKLGGQETNAHKTFFEKYIDVVLDGEDTDLSKVRRGDMLLNTLHNDEIKASNPDFVFKNHVILIKDVLHDNDGSLLGFNLVESTTPFVRAFFETSDTLKSRMTNQQPYSVIRAKSSLLRLLDVEQVKYSKSVYPNKGDGGKYTLGGVLKRAVSKEEVGENADGSTKYEYTFEDICNDEVQLYIPDTTATAISVNGTTVALADLETATVNNVTVYKLPIEVAGTYTIATNIAPDDPCTVIVKEVE